MAAPMTEKVHVQFDPSESETDESDNELSRSDEDETPERAKSENVQNVTGKTGLADVFAKILHKNVPVHKQVILAKGKTDKEIQKRKLEKGDEEDSKKAKVQTESSVKSSTKVKTESGMAEPAAQLAKEEKMKQWENMCRVKPDPLEREKERQLQRIATRGVVQLFNAVRKQQKLVEEEIQQVGGSERKKEKIMEGMTKDKFLSILKGPGSRARSEKSDNTNVNEDSSDSDDDDTVDKNRKKGDKQWDILRDDYMMGAKMKDWDNDNSDDDDDEEEEDAESEGPDLSDSD